MWIQTEELFILLINIRACTARGTLKILQEANGTISDKGMIYGSGCVINALAFLMHKIKKDRLTFVLYNDTIYVLRKCGGKSEEKNG